MIFIWTCALFACLGGNYTFFPTIITETFGVRYNGVIIGLLLLAEIPSSILFTFLCDNIQEIFGGWDKLIIAVACFSAASCLLSITFSPTIDHDKYHEWHKQNEIEALEELEEKDKQAKLRAIQKESFHNIDNRSVQSIERAKKQNRKLDKQRRKLKEQQQHAQRAQQQIQNRQIQSYREGGDTGAGGLLPSGGGDGRDYLLRNDDNGNDYNDYNGDEIKLIDPDEQHQNSWHAYSSVIGGILVQLVLGTLFSFGNLVPYFATYLTYWKHHSEGNYTPDKSCETYKDDYTNFVSYCNWIFAVAVIAEAGASVLGGRFEIKMGAARSCMFGSFILSSGVGLTYFAIENLYLTILTYGLMFGLGAGIAYPGSIVCGMKWWPHRRGMVTGLIAAGFGSGAFCFDYIQTIYVNPHDAPVSNDCGFLESEYVVNRIPGLFLMLAGIYLVMQISGVLMLKDPPPEDGDNQESGDFEEDRSYIGHDYRSLKSEELGMDKRNYTPGEALKTWKFWQLFLNSVTNVTVFLFVSAEWKIFASDYLGIGSDSFLAIVGSVSSLCNGVCRIFWGLFYDWNGSFAISMGTMCAIMTAFTATMTFCDVECYNYLLFSVFCFLFFVGGFVVVEWFECNLIDCGNQFVLFLLFLFAFAFNI